MSKRFAKIDSKTKKADATGKNAMDYAD